MRDDYKKYFQNLPNVSSYEIKKHKKLDEQRLLMIIEWKGKAPIPSVLQHLLSPKMLKWLNKGIWDEKDHSLKWTAKTFYYRDIFTSEGEWKIKKKDKKNSIVILEGFIDIRMAVFGPIAEKFIVYYMKRNLKVAEKNLKNLLQKKYGK
jgi:hypothetical protein